MDQLQLLWDFQQADGEVDKVEASIKRSPTRQKLVSYRNYLIEQQNIMKQIEEEIASMADRLEVLKDAVALVEDQLRSLQNKIESEPPADTASSRQYLADAQKLISTINQYEQEIAKIRKDSGDRDRKQHDVKVHAAKAKGEFDKLKVVYDAEYKEKTAEVEKLRAVAAEKAKDIEPEYMEKYKTIKRHSVPPLARLNGDQCGGCNMSLPSGAVRNIKAGKQIECETCGRLLIL